MKTLSRILYSISALQTPSFPHTGPLWQFLKTVPTAGAHDAHRNLTHRSIHSKNNSCYSHSFGTITLTMFWRVQSVILFYSCELWANRNQPAQPEEIFNGKDSNIPAQWAQNSGCHRESDKLFQWVFYIGINRIFSSVNSSMGQAVVLTQNIWV